MSFFSFLGALSPVSMFWTRILTGARFVGADTAGNRYYVAKARKGYAHDRRFVKYHGEPDASKIPPEWHGWMHYTSDIVPSDASDTYRRSWQKPYISNKTGTDLAYRPPGHQLEGGKRAPATGDYEAWKPD